MKLLGWLTYMVLNVITTGLLFRYGYHRVLVPTFPGLPPHITLAQACGVGVFIAWITTQVGAHNFNEDEVKILVVSAFYDVIVLFAFLVIGLWI